MPGLVAAPAHIGTADIQNRIRLQFTQHCIVAFPIVNLLFAVFALAAGPVSYTHLDVYKRQSQQR